MCGGLNTPLFGTLGLKYPKQNGLPKPRRVLFENEVEKPTTLDKIIASISLYPSIDEEGEIRAFIKFRSPLADKGEGVKSATRTGCMVFKRGITRKEGVGFYPKSAYSVHRELKVIFRALREELVLSVQFSTTDADNGFGTETVQIVDIRD